MHNYKMSEIQNSSCDLNYNFECMNMPVSNAIPYEFDGLTDDAIRCGEILFIKNAWCVLFQCVYCQKKLQNLDMFLKHSLEHIFDINGEDEIKKKLSGLLPAATNTKSQQSGEIINVNGIEWEISNADPIANIKTEEINIVDTNDPFNNLEKCEGPKPKSPNTEDGGTTTNGSSTCKELSTEHKQSSEEEDKFLQNKKCEVHKVDSSSTKTTIPANRSGNKNTKTVSRKMDEKDYVCPVCKKRFMSMKYYDNHIIRHKTDRPYKCNICEAAFNDRGNLYVHRRRHLGVQPHQCQLCDKRFTTTTELKIHQRSHTGEKPFVCEKCGSSYSTSSRLQDHIRRHTNTRSHACGECDKKFYNKRQLKDHIITHSEARPYKCDVCSMAFKCRKTLRQHNKLHLKLFEYKCLYCEKAFQQNAGLHSHIKSVHGKLK